MDLPPKTQTIESFPSLRLEEDLVQVRHVELIGEVNLLSSGILVEDRCLTLGEMGLREDAVLAKLGVHEVNVVRLDVGEGGCGCSHFSVGCRW